MWILEEYLDNIQSEQMASAAYDYPRPYNILRAYYSSCARSCSRLQNAKGQKALCIVNCKINVLKKELLLAQRGLALCGRTGNLACQDKAKKKIIKVQKKLYAATSIAQRYRANLK